MVKLIKNFSKLLIMVGLFCVLYFGSVFTIIAPQYEEGYNASLLDKENRLMSIKEPKIILVGNSNVALGINSQRLEEAVGMPVVNMGLHGALGNRMLERTALPGIKRGDLVIVCHSSYVDEGNIPDPEIAWITIENHKELWKLLDIEEWKDIIPALPQYSLKVFYLWMSKTGNARDAIYNRRNFNIYGDYVLKRNEQSHSFGETFLLPEINEVCVSRLNNMNQYCIEKEATMLIAGYPICASKSESNIQDITYFENELKSRLTCEVISNYVDYMYSNEYFYDTALHLTTQGAELRTNQLIKDIIKYLEINKNEGM